MSSTYWMTSIFVLRPASQFAAPRKSMCSSTPARSSASRAKCSLFDVAVHTFHPSSFHRAMSSAMPSKTVKRCQPSLLM